MPKTIAPPTLFMGEQNPTNPAPFPPYVSQLEYMKIHIILNILSFVTSFTAS
jgi:hypothetical protein